MHQHVIYIYTHDSIGLGEDGPTHQPIEQLSALRAIPGHDGDPSGRRERDGGGVAGGGRARARPGRARADAAEARRSSTATKYASADGVAKGAYVLADRPTAARRRSC